MNFLLGVSPNLQEVSRAITLSNGKNCELNSQTFCIKVVKTKDKILAGKTGVREKNRGKWMR